MEYFDTDKSSSILTVIWSFEHWKSFIFSINKLWLPSVNVRFNLTWVELLAKFIYRLLQSVLYGRKSILYSETNCQINIKKMKFTVILDIEVKGIVHFSISETLDGFLFTVEIKVIPVMLEFLFNLWELFSTICINISWTVWLPILTKLEIQLCIKYWCDCYLCTLQ